MMDTLPSNSPMEASRTHIEECVQEWRELRTQRLAMEKDVAKVKAMEDEYKNFIIEAMSTQKIEGVVIDQRLSYIREREIPIAEDREALTNYILETRDLSLLQFRLHEGAIKERLEEGVEVPGVAMLTKFELGDKKA